MKRVPLKELRIHTYFKLNINSDTVYMKEYYDRKNKQYHCVEIVHNHGADHYIPGDTIVLVPLE